MDLNNLSFIKKAILNSDNDKIAGLYNIGNTIGKGHYAVVKEAKHAFTGEKVAIKVIDKTKLDVQSSEHLFSEVMCMKLVQHPNVVRLYEVIDTATKLYLILELGDGGDLYDYIMKFENGLPEVKAKRYFRQIVQAISYCHNLHVVHRDLKPENVVFFEKVELVKLTDFGFSNKFIPGKTLDTSCGSLAYSAPEILLGDSYDAPKVDIWSLGVILYMLVCGHLPFEEANDSETLSKIMDCKFELPVYLSDSCKNLIKKMLVREPEKRSCLEEILSDNWLEYENESNFALDTFSVPLISQEHLTVEEHVEILTKMSEGNLASVEDIQSILDRNEYSYISATYFLLAERKLKRRYLENYCKMKLLEMEKEAANCQELVEEEDLVQMSSPASQKSANNIISPITETNEDRIRRFSMILEDEEDEAEEEELEAMISLASVREELELTVPKFEVSSQSGVSAPFPSRCCSRLSDSIDNNNQDNNNNPDLDNSNNYRFSTFRQQFATRNRCRSAIYNRRSLIYASHSLTSIPNCTIHEENNSNSQTPSSSSHIIRSPHKSNNSKFKSLMFPINLNLVPRFQRNFSGTFNKRTSSISSSSGNDRSSFDDNFHYLTKHRVSLPNSSQQPSSSLNQSKKRCSYPALFSSAGVVQVVGNPTNLSHSHSSSDVSDNEISILRGFNERKKITVPKSFGKQHFFSSAICSSSSSCSTTHSKYINYFKPAHTPELMMSTSSIDSDGSFATTGTAGTKVFCTTNRRLRIKSGRSRPSSMGATMGTPFEDFQSMLMCGGGVGGQMISEEEQSQFSVSHGNKGDNNNKDNSNMEQNTSSNNNNSNNNSGITISSITNSPTVASITMHRDICAPIHEEEELIRSRSYIDKETSLDNDISYSSSYNHHHLHHHPHPPGTLPISPNAIDLSYRSVSIDCRRKSESAEGTPAKWISLSSSSSAANRKQQQQQRGGGGGNLPITNVPLQSTHKLDSHSLSSQLTQSNFSLSSFASSLRDSKAMMNLVRGVFELQCMANKIKTNCNDDDNRHHHHHHHYRYRSDACASATVSGRESRCEYASVTSLPLGGAGGGGGGSGSGGGGNKLLHSPDDSESLLVVRNRESVPDCNQNSSANPVNAVVVIESKKKLISHSADQIDKKHTTTNKSSSLVYNNNTNNSTTTATSTNPFIRASSNMSRKARFILSCCRPS